MNSIIPFIVEKTLNSSYIDSLFVALFFEQSHIQNILSEYPENSAFIYLQELIHEHFVWNMRRNYFIDSVTINEIRNYMVLCGWGSQDITGMYEVQDLYNFLINGFHKSKLNFSTTEYVLKMNYIELHVTKNDSINTMLDAYMDEKLPEYQFPEVPNFIPIYLNRNTETKNTKLNNFFVDIKQGISVSKNNINKEQKNLVWVIHSIICCSRNGNYYAVVTNGTSWYLFNNNFQLPSLLKIDIKNEDVSAKIKQECVFIMYVNP